MLELYPKSEININIHILESDGSIITTILNAATLALMDAGISMRDMYCFCFINLFIYLFIHVFICLFISSHITSL